MLVKRFLPGVYGLSAESKTKHCIEAALFGRLDQMLRVTESRRNKKHLIKAVLLGRLHQMLRTQFAKFVSILFFAFLQMYSLWMISLTAFRRTVEVWFKWKAGISSHEAVADIFQYFFKIVI